VSKKCACGIGHQVSRSVDNEVSIQDIARASSRASKGSDPADLRGKRSANYPRISVARSRTHVVVGPSRHSSRKIDAVHQRPIIAPVARRVNELRKRYWGQHLWARGYLCAAVGALDETTIREYSENQKWDEEGDGSRSRRPPSLKPALSRAPLRRLQPQARLSVGIQRTSF
jgi:hypothetical protein